MTATWPGVTSPPSLERGPCLWSWGRREAWELEYNNNRGRPTLNRIVQICSVRRRFSFRTTLQYTGLECTTLYYTILYKPILHYTKVYCSDIRPNQNNGEGNISPCPRCRCEPRSSEKLHTDILTHEHTGLHWTVFSCYWVKQACYTGCARTIDRCNFFQQANSTPLVKYPYLKQEEFECDNVIKFCE